MLAGKSLQSGNLESSVGLSGFGDRLLSRTQKSEIRREDSTADRRRLQRF